MEDPLTQFWVKTEQVEGEDRALLARMIIPFASGIPDTGEIRFKAKADTLTARHKIIVFLLSRLALSTIPETTFSALATPKEIENGLHLPGGTVRPTLAKLLDDHIAVKKGDAYMIPSANLNRAHNDLKSVVQEE
ncbi:MAG: hypothetical protein WCF84_08095 [Anaerolineae bacterium]